MGHTASLYTVRVKEHRGDHQLLGAFDSGAPDGSNLVTVFSNYLQDFLQKDANEERAVSCLEFDANGDEIVATFQHGETGLVSDIVSSTGVPRYHQVFADQQLIRCYGLFELPAAQSTGWLALHVNNRRGIKGLLAAGFWVKFRDDYPQHTLEINPYVQQAALMQAIDNGDIIKVKLIRYEKPNDRAVQETTRWIQAGSEGKIEVDISGRARAQRLKNDLLRRYYHGDRTAYHSIIEFAGITFEEAKIEVELADGRTRTFNIQSPELGFAMTVDLEGVEVDDAEGPTKASVVAGLRDALGSV